MAARAVIGRAVLRPLMSTVMRAAPAAEFGRRLPHFSCAGGNAGGADEVQEGRGSVEDGGADWPNLESRSGRGDRVVLSDPGRPRPGLLFGVATARKTRGLAPHAVAGRVVSRRGHSTIATCSALSGGRTRGADASLSRLCSPHSDARHEARRHLLT